MMNPVIRDQWADALESGEYQQCKGALTRVAEDGSESHCCLGVLSILSEKAGVVRRIPHWASNTIGYGVDETCYSSALPVSEIARWAGMDDNNPNVIWKGESYALAELNDSDDCGLSFTEIAKLIREQL